MEKRPFAFSGALVMLSFLLFKLPWVWNAVLLIGGVLVFFVKKHTLKRTALVALAIFTASGMLLLLRDLAGAAKTSAIDGRTVYLEGYVCELPQKGTSATEYTVKLEHASLHEELFDLGGKGSFYLSDAEQIALEEYDRIGFYAKAESVKVSQREDGIAYNLTLKSAPTLLGKQDKNIYYHCLQMKKGFLSRLEADGADEGSALLSALLLGDKSKLSGETDTALRRSGVSHLMVVSGVHLVTVTVFVYEILKRLLRRSPTVIAIILVWVMAALTAFSPSAVRAAVMMTVLLGGELFGREADALNSLGVAVTFMLLVSPGTAQDIGFLLSVFATLGLILFANKWSNAFKRLMKVTYKTPQPLKGILSGLAEVMGQSLSAWAAVFPVTVIFFGRVSVVAPLANLLVGFAASITLVFAFCAACIPFIGVLFLRLAKVGAAWILWVTKGLAGLPFSYIEISAIFAVLCITAVAAALFYSKRFGRYRLAALSLVGAVIFCGRIGEGLHNARVCRVDSLYLGNATAAYITCGGERVLYLADVSPQELPALLKSSEYCGINGATAVIAGDAYSIAAAEAAAERLGGQTLLPTYRESTSVAELGRAKLTAVSKESKLNLFVTCGSTVLAFTDGEMLKGDYGAVFCSRSMPTDGILITDAPSEYEETDAEKVFFTCENGSVTLCSDGKRIYEI